MKALTNRQREILNFIKEFIKKHKYPPTIREIASNFSISVKGAYDHVKALEKKEQIKCDLGRSRAIEIIEDGSESAEFVEVPLIGHVAAGIPLFAEENWDGVLKVSSQNLNQGKHFALHVQGDSMEGAGILDGDVAIFEQRQHADNGDIVVAIINDEAVTLKRFYKEKNRVKLKAENPIYPPIYTQSVRVLGKLSCIIRNYD
jgi:repressor LexA